MPRVPVVAIGYDLLHLCYPDHLDTAERERRDRHWARVLAQANVIACISEFTMTSIRHHFPDADPDRLVVVHPAVHQRLAEGAPADNWRPDRPFALYPANVWPHKNHGRLLDAYAVYRARRGRRAIDLVLTGFTSDGEQRLRDQVARLGLAGHVHLLGYVDEPTMGAIWRTARCIVFPSLYEGFGIPLVEAMWHETPAAAARVASLPEVGGEAVSYFDPTDSLKIAAALDAVAHDGSLRRRLVAAGRARRGAFTFEAMVAGYLECLERAAREGAPP